jgi:hypothetical protein
MSTQQRVQIAGAGVALVSLILSSVASVWPELIKPHPYLLGIFGLIGVVLIVVPLFVRSTPETPQVENSIMGHQIVSHGDVYFGQPFDPAFEKKEIQPAPLALQTEEKFLDLKLIPHGDNDTSAYLEVLNHGETANVDAQLRIVGLSTGESFKTLPFGGEWRSEFANTGHLGNQFSSYAGSARIDPNKSRLLTIATIASMVVAPFQEMAIVGIDDEVIGWPSSPKQSQELPYYTIQITLIAKGYPKTISVTYKVGPKTTHGPFQMTEVDV